MANSEEYKKELDYEFKVVQRKSMKRAKPPQPIYKPGSGPLRKTNTIEESESDTKLVINLRQNESKNPSTDDFRHKSEGNSPRDRVTDLDSASSRLGDITPNKDRDKDNVKKQKKPEQALYVPKPVAQARELSASQDSNRNIYSHTNGNDKSIENDRYNSSNRFKFYLNKKFDDREDWREKSPAFNNRPRQGSEPRGISNEPTVNWHRTRDTRSVEPSVPPNRGYGEKIPLKPPSGRRNSSAGLPRPFKPANLEQIPPRFRKMYSMGLDNGASPEDTNWDGSSLTFQGHINTNYGNLRNPSFHQMSGSHCSSLVTGPHCFHNQTLGYHTLPNKQRGRGRLHQEYHEGPASQMYHSVTPDSIRSPNNSRPPTPTRRPRTPVNYEQLDAGYQEKGSQNLYGNDSIPEEKTGIFSRWDYRHGDYDRSRGQGGRDGKNFNRDRYNRREDDVRVRPTPSMERDVKKDLRKNTVGRDNRRGNYDRRRNNRGDRRSSSREYNRGDSNKPEEADKTEAITNIVLETKTVSNAELFKYSLDALLSPVSPEDKSPLIQEEQKVITTLNWSEEVELTAKLEAENFSDALTRSSSVTSLQEASTKSLPPNINTTTPPGKKKKKNKKSRNGSGARDSSSSRVRRNSSAAADSQASFKTPPPYRDGLFSRRKGSRDRRESRDRRRGGSRESSWDRRPSEASINENWREGCVRSRQNSERDVKTNLDEIKNVDGSTKKAGVIVLPQQKPELQPSHSTVLHDYPRYPESRKSPGGLKKSLFDPNNPNKPIIVKSSSSRVSVPGFSDNAEATPPQVHTTDQFGNLRPQWYDETSVEFKACHYQDLLRDIKRADKELQYIISNGWLLVNWDSVELLRNFLKEALKYLLCKSIKFCQSENVEHHFWKILYHNIIEVARKAIKNDPASKDNYKAFLLCLIDEGTKYFEGLLSLLEETYNFKLSNFLGENNGVSHKGLGLVNLALISAQKLFLFLGDLGRYSEEVNESTNYGKCRQWYIKSHEINPKNGKPYNQLALLAIYARRKLDAVYYYMRSLMSSNPVPSARDSLISLLDENRKKYEQGELKRREERLQRQRRRMKQKEHEEPSNGAGCLRKETWVHPEGGRRVHRTTREQPERLGSEDEAEEELGRLSSVEVNKRFVISYLHVHGKLITNIGMETFQETAKQMLREFRALLQQSPVPLPCNRFLQLLALNMFAIESTQLRDPQLQSNPGYHSELQERALVVSLQMFDLILERCVVILQDHLALLNESEVIPVDKLPPDAIVLLPAVKVWCDWLLGHTQVWNPPPSTQDFRVGSSGDAWTRLAILMNLLEKMDQSISDSFVGEQQEGYVPVRLPEDAALQGFAPLAHTAGSGPEGTTAYAPARLDREAVRAALRLSRLRFFGTVYLCGVDPPVLKLEIAGEEGGVNRGYVSVVAKDEANGGVGSPKGTDPSDEEMERHVLLESVSGEEDLEEDPQITSNTSSEIRDLLTRKVELEKRKRSQELHMQRVKKILSQSVVSVHIEVRPKNLVPDTNCFIDHLQCIKTIAQSHCYTLMVPIVVLSELEGLSRGGKAPTPDSRGALDPSHIRKVASAAKDALEFLRTRHASVKCVTTKGAVIPSTTFSTEDDGWMNENYKNDDKILTTCVVLCKGHKDQQLEAGEPRRLTRDVVLLTEDRNLRVKAYARDVPVRELPDFVRWTGLG